MKNKKIAGVVALRPVMDSDLDTFFAMQRDPRANHMAAFTPEKPDDRAAFDADWKRRRSDASILARTILFDGQVAGSIMKFILYEQPNVGYAIRQDLWGRGIATRALSLLLAEIDECPLYARAAKDNRASLRVLEKCGFRVIGEEFSFANARGEEIAEAILRLDP